MASRTGGADVNKRRLTHLLYLRSLTGNYLIKTDVVVWRRQQLAAGGASLHSLAHRSGCNSDWNCGRFMAVSCSVCTAGWLAGVSQPRFKYQPIQFTYGRSCCSRRDCVCLTRFFRSVSLLLFFFFGLLHTFVCFLAHKSVPSPSSLNTRAPSYWCCWWYSMVSFENTHARIIEIGVPAV